MPSELPLPFAEGRPAELERALPPWTLQAALRANLRGRSSIDCLMDAMIDEDGVEVTNKK